MPGVKPGHDELNIIAGLGPAISCSPLRQCDSAGGSGVAGWALTFVRPFDWIWARKMTDAQANAFAAATVRPMKLAVLPR